MIDTMDVGQPGHHYRAVLRAAMWTALAVVVWRFYSKLPMILFACGMAWYALARRSRGAGAWRNAAGTAFIVLLAAIILLLPFSVSPRLAARSFALVIPVLVVTAAIPAVFDTRERIESSLLYSAVAVTLILAVDLGRLAWLLRDELVRRARNTLPYVLNHPNVASMVAGAAVVVFVYFAWKHRRNPSRLSLCIAAVIVDLAYMVVMSSRGPQLAFAATCFLFGILLPGWRRKLVWFGVLAALALLAYGNIEHVNRRFTRPDTRTLNERNKVWAHTYKLATDRPVLGHGFGKKVFEKIYYESDEPRSKHMFPHPHNYWLKVLFESGWAGVGLHLAAWLLLGIRLARHTFKRASLSERLLPGTVMMILCLVHLYAVADYPDEAVRIMQLWLIPVSLVLTRSRPEEPP